MSGSTWNEGLAAASTDGPAVTNLTTRASLIGSEAQPILASNFLRNTGQTLKITAGGRVSTAAASPGTLTISAVLGGTAATGTAVASFTTPTVAVSLVNASWYLEWFLQLRGIGASATFMHVAEFQSALLGGTTAAPTGSIFPNTAPAVGATFDARLALQLDFTATWSVASASNTITTHLYLVQSMN